MTGNNNMKSYIVKKWFKNRDHRLFTYPEDVDGELIQMLDVFNNIPGVRTLYSCCGHGNSQWYMVFNCTSDFMVNVLLNYFGDCIDVSDDEYLTKLKMGHLKFELEYDENASDNDVNHVPEKKVVVRSELLGRMNESRRKKEYKKICEFFSSFAPYRTWGKIQEF